MLMGDLKVIPPDVGSDEIKKRVSAYWTRRAEGFAEIRDEEAQSYKAVLWREDIAGLLPEGEKLRILDVGCGTGFFEIVLDPLGHSVTGIDLTPEMIEKGRELLARYGINSDLMVMDAEKPEFPDYTFDAVISRNLTWNLPHPEAAYREWYRVLRPGGVLINYDAEYAKGVRKYDQSENLAHKNVAPSLTEECNRIYQMLTVSFLNRPEWDVKVLKDCGFTRVIADTTAGDRLYGIKDAFYMPDRIFCVRAVK